jgi:hypothetical protein
MPAWANAFGTTGSPPALAPCGAASATDATTAAAADQSAPETCRPRLAIVYDGPRGMLSFVQIPTPLRSPKGPGLIHASASTAPGTIALILPRGNGLRWKGDVKTPVSCVCRS